MKKMMLMLAVAAVCAPAWGAYYIKIDGVTVGAEFTMTVGTPYQIEIWSDSATPMSVEPTASSAYLQDCYNLIMWTVTWAAAPEAFTNMVVNHADAGWSATGWTSASPYQNIANVGFAIGYPWGQPVAAGKWWQVTYTPLFEADRTLGLGSYPPNYSEFRNAQFVTIHQVPEPATLALLGLGAVGLLRKRG